MKISRIIMVSNNTAYIDTPIYLYKGDGNVLISLDIINITISTKLNQMSTTSYINDNISYATACLCKKDSSSTVHIVGTKVNDKIELELKKDMMDETVEVGEYRMQVHLFDKENNRLTIPVVEEINIMLPLCSDGYTPPIAYSSKIGEATVDYSKVVAESISASSDFYHTYNWTTGEYITANKLNNMITGIDEALYDIKNIQNNYVTKSELNNKADKNEIPTKTSQLLNDEGYLTEHQDLSNYATKSYVDSEIANAQLSGGENVDLSGYATKEELNTKADEVHSHPEYVNPDLSNYATKTYVSSEIAKAQLEGGEVDLDPYALKEDIPTKLSDLQNDSNFLSSIPSEYVTETELNSKGYLTEHQSLDNYATKVYVDDEISKINTEGVYDDSSIQNEIILLKNDKAKYQNIMGLGFDINVDNNESCTFQFREIIDYCVNNNIKPFVPKGEYLFTPELHDGVKYNCWVVPDGLDIYFEKGVIFRLVDDPKIESKLVVMGNDVKFYGELTLIGNADTGARYGEMQSNMFIYKKRNVYIERLISKQSWGDNLFIGGENKTYEDLSRNIKIDYFNGIDAKRKNLVFQHCTDVYIKNAYLDNSRYGINSLDVEPDNWHLSSLCCTNTIEYLYVKGIGIDLTANTDVMTAKNYIVNINKFVIDITGGNTAVLFTYAITLNIKEFILNSVSEDVVINRLIDTTYGSFITINNIITLSDRINQILRMSASTGAFGTLQHPSVAIEKLIFKRNEHFYDGVLFDNSGGVLKLGDIVIESHKNVVVKCNNTSKICELYVNNIKMNNCGVDNSSLIVLDRINGDEYVDYVNMTDIKHMSVAYDNDMDVNLYAIIQANESETTKFLKLGNVINPSSKTILNANSLVNKTLTTKIGGIDGLPCIYSLKSTPEGGLFADKGSLAVCSDGNTYIKTTGIELSTGWVVYTNNGNGFSGDYNDLINKPTIPTLEGYATESYVNSEIARVQLSGGVIDEEPSNVVDLVIFMGQSNMAGRGVASEAPTVPSGHGYEFRAISDPTRLYDIIEPFGVNENNSTSGVSETSKTGSMVSAFVNEYYNRTGVPIVGVSCSKGGTRSTYWNPGTDALNDAIERHNVARAWLESNGYVVRRDFMVWCQGETDGDLSITDVVWEKSVASIISEMKNKTLVECCMVIRIGNHRDDSTKYDTIIKATNSLCFNNPSAILVSTCLASFAEKGLMKDQFHYTQEGYNLVGEEAGKYSAYYINENREPMIYDPEYNNYYTPNTNMNTNTDSNISSQLTEMENTILALEARIAVLEGQPLPSYTVTINPTPSNATVKINDIEQTSVTVTKGSSINWVVSLDGYQTKSGSLTVTSNETLDITLTMINLPDQSDTTVLEFNFDSETENGVDLSACGTLSDGNIYVNKTIAQLANPVTVSSSESFTIEVIAKADTTVEGLTDWATGTVLSRGASTTAGYFQLPHGTNKAIQFVDSARATTVKGACSSVDTTVKNHFAMVYDANAQNISMYANGESLTVNYTVGSASTITTFDFTHVLGGVYSSSKDFGYVGNIYYLRISNTALLPENFHIE